MASITGTVTKISIYEDFAEVKVEASNDKLNLMLWSDYDEDYTPAQRIVHGMWLTLCRDALANGSKISITTASDNSSLAYSVTLQP